MRRFVCLWLPRWPLQRFLQALQGRKAAPFILYEESSRSGQIVAQASTPLLKYGVSPGMSLTDARALLGRNHFEAAPLEPAKDLWALRKLAIACQQFSPIVGVEESDAPDSLLFDITGCIHLFGDEQNFCRQVLEFLEQQGYRGRIAIADTLGLAWGMAHCQTSSHRRYRITSGLELRGLPVEALRLPESILERLREFDLSYVEQVLRLARNTLRPRFGSELPQRLDQLTGQLSELLIPETLPEPVCVREKFDEGTTDRRRIEFYIEQMLDQLLVLLTLKYHDEMKDEIQKKQTSLADEAIAIHSAIEHLYAAHSHEDIQRYIDDISSRMRQSDGLEHHIAIQLEPNSILTNSQDRCDGALLAAMKRATRPGSEQTHEPPNLVSADYSAGGVSVYVAESLAEIRSAKWNEIKQQLTVLGLLACLAALIVNLVLLRTVGHPSGVLSNTVDSISRGDFHVRAPAFRSREMQQLSLSVNEMSKALQLVESERQAQLAKAQAIQAHLLPNEVVLPAAETGHLFQPADIVAGDYYDFIPREDGDWGICLADVTGHGIPAALGATMLKSYL
ncbi:MAG: HAMP domain-containing protein [Rubinisphaera brasiliensis]|uniref:Y-family DNA polymerase n=1 Tax=Rubinisphaera brasiliensis TaxID=119 RepID=UPI00391DFAB1